MVWGYSPALGLSLVCGSLYDVLRSGAALRAGDTWQERGFLLLQGKRRSTVWGCLGDVGMVYGQGLADGSSLLPGGLSLLMAGPVCGIKKFFSMAGNEASLWRRCGARCGASTRRNLNVCGASVGPNENGVTAFCRNPLISLARSKRFELLTYRFVACCSIQLSYERVTKRLYVIYSASSSFFIIFFRIFTTVQY